MNITYTMQGDYRFPDLALPEQDKRPMGIWGQRHKNYLLRHHKVRYYNLLTSCKLVEYLADINEQAEDMYEHLVKQFAEQEGCTEQLKAANQMLWIQKMNVITNSVIERINSELIFI